MPAGTASPTSMLVADLEHLMGDPLDTTGPFTFAETVANEERDRVPPGAVESLRGWGLTEHLIPHNLGGKLHSLETAVLLMRSVSRRNLTLAVMFGSTALGAQPVWLWGTREQQRELVEGLLAGDGLCLAVSERATGSDLNQTSTTARRDGDHYVLDGEKWPVGNATRGRFFTVLAASERGGVLLLADKRRLPRGSWCPRPAVRTVGLRGHDLSGVVFSGAAVPATAVIGRPGRGTFELLKCLQITRTAIGGMSLGSMDAALRIGSDYARDRRLYGAEIYQIPVVREHLLGAHLDLLIAECVTLPVARSLSIVPSRLALWSSVVKYLVPVVGEEMLEHVAKVLGARCYLREGVAFGAFQKIRRDHAITTVFDGTTHVNLSAIAAQLSALAPLVDNPPDGIESTLTQLFDLSAQAPPYSPDGEALRPATYGRDDITQGWKGTVAELARTVAGNGSPDQARDFDEVIRELDRRRKRLYGSIATSGMFDPSSRDGSRAAVEHCVFHAAAACAEVWLYNRSARGDIGLLILLLQRLIQRLDPGTSPCERYLSTLESAVAQCRARNEYFGIQSVLF